MEYHALTFDLPDNLYQNLEHKFAEVGGTLTAAFSLRDALQRCEKEMFHFAVLNFENSGIFQDFVGALRRTSYMPIVVLTDNSCADTVCPMIKNGADLCIPAYWPLNILIEHIMAMFRRYTEYNHSYGLRFTAPFRKGDFFIDEARRIVTVRDRPVKLRPREFALLLYFMQNSGIILTSGQICENAWGTDGIYDYGIAQPIRLLRQAVEPNPKKPVYIETVQRVGYRFTAKGVEICDIS